MTKSDTSYDVFVAYSPVDRELAGEIASACSEVGLRAFTGSEVATGASIADTIWEALSECRAVIAIFSRPELAPTMAIELGGARAWNKPIFGVLTDPTRQPPSVGLGDVHLYTPSRIGDLVRAIQASGEVLSSKEREALANIYSEAGVNLDQLAFDPTPLGSLVRRFNRATDKAVTGERLLSELLRMRKQGRLPSSGARTRRARHATGTE
jgi:hypothetical protein